MAPVDPTREDLYRLEDQSLKNRRYGNMWSSPGELGLILLRHGNRPSTVEELIGFLEKGKRVVHGRKLGGMQGLVPVGDRRANKRFRVDKEKLAKVLFRHVEPVIKKMYL